MPGLFAEHMFPDNCFLKAQKFKPLAPKFQKYARSAALAQNKNIAQPIDFN